MHHTFTTPPRIEPGCGGLIAEHDNHYTVEMATAQRTRPRAVVGAPRRAAWQLKSALRNSISAAPRTIIFLHFFYNYCW